MSRPVEIVDYAILGGGMAGLTMAQALVPTLQPGERLAVVEPREQYQHDRTFCYWDVAPIAADTCVKHRWNKWLVRSGGKTTVAQSDKYSYSYVPADAFYEQARSLINDSEQAELFMNQSAGTVKKTSYGRSHVTTSAGTLDAKWVLDTRPSPELVEAAETLQHFVGLHLRFDKPVFDPTTITLMDFDVSQEHGLHFLYVLPFSETEALVESTFFSAKVLSQETYEQYIHDYLRERFGVTDSMLDNAELVRMERGVVPMTPKRLAQPDNPAWHKLGTPGGFVRPATGYCFHATGRFALEKQVWLKRPFGSVPPIRSKALDWLDKVLLGYLNRAPAEAPEIFYSMFERVHPDALVRFLSNVGTVADTLSVMLAMPVWPFVKEAVGQCFDFSPKLLKPSSGLRED